jgi:hypothetical protein
MVLVQLRNWLLEFLAVLPDVLTVEPVAVSPPVLKLLLVEVLLDFLSIEFV